MSEKAWLDVSILQCPECGRYYVDALWYAVELESDIKCGNCHGVFNAKKGLMDRLMLEYKVDARGKALEVKIPENVQMESKEK